MDASTALDGRKAFSVGTNVATGYGFGAHTKHGSGSLQTENIKLAERLAKLEQLVLVQPKEVIST